MEKINEKLVMLVKHKYTINYNSGIKYNCLINFYSNTYVFKYNYY